MAALSAAHAAQGELHKFNLIVLLARSDLVDAEHISHLYHLTALAPATLSRLRTARRSALAGQRRPQALARRRRAGLGVTKLGRRRAREGQRG